MKENNNNNMQPNMKSFAGFGFRTKASIRYTLLLMLSIIPFIIFMSIPALNGQAGTEWGISMGTFVLDLIILTVLRIFYKEQIKIDMYPAVVSMTWFFIAWYALPIPWWGKILVSIAFYFVMYIIALITTIGIVFYIQKRKVEKVIEDLSDLTGSNQNPFFEEIQKNMQNQEQNQQSMNQTKENLDQILREQGIDIDSLDKEFGSFFKEEELKIKVDLEKESVTIDDFLDEEIIIPKEDLKKEKEINEQSTIEDKKIIDQ